MKNENYRLRIFINNFETTYKLIVKVSKLKDILSLPINIICPNYGRKPFKNAKIK